MKTAIILAGGLAKRAGGRPKHEFEYDGKTFIDRSIESLSCVVDEIIVVARDEEHCECFRGLGDVRVLCDIRKNIGPLGGIHAGIKSCSGDLVFITACDMPHINPGAVRRLFGLIDGHDAVIPEWENGMIEPLHAVYRRSALEEHLWEHESRSIRSIIDKIDAVFVDPESFRDIDPDLGTFTNVNSLEELEKINGRIRR